MLKFIVPAAITAAAATVYLVSVFQSICVKKYTVGSEKLTGSVRIVQISDLHNNTWGKNHEVLLSLVDKAAPDIVVFTGDIGDERSDCAPSLEVFTLLGEKYRCYYVIGNHEAWLDDVSAYKKQVAERGVTVLEGAGEVVEVNGAKVRVCGVDDPRLFINRGDETGWYEQLDICKALSEDGIFTLLCSHRPEEAAVYEKYGFDLVLCGHAHGGQIRIPGLFNGIYAPNQGFFPKYAGGRYSLGDTEMIVSRGLSRTALPRTFNPPELVVIDIKGTK